MAQATKAQVKRKRTKLVGAHIATPLGVVRSHKWQARGFTSVDEVYRVPVAERSDDERAAARIMTRNQRHIQSAWDKRLGYSGPSDAERRRMKRAELLKAGGSGLPRGWHKVPCLRRQPELSAFGLEPCNRAWCMACRAIKLRTACRPPEQLIRMVGDHASYGLVTMGRRGAERTQSLGELVRFRASVRALDLVLRSTLAAGAVWVNEVKVHADEPGTGNRCCHELTDDCPLCRGSGVLPAGHLHAHGVVMVRRGQWWPMGALNSLVAPKLIDHRAGCVNVALRSKRQGPEGSTVDGAEAVRYLFGYAAKNKDPLQAAWFRAMAPDVRLVERTGSFRGAVRRESTKVEARSVTRTWQAMFRDSVPDVAAMSRDITRRMREWDLGEVPKSTQLTEALRADIDTIRKAS